MLSWNVLKRWEFKQRLQKKMSFNFYIYIYIYSDILCCVCYVRMLIDDKVDLRSSSGGAFVSWFMYIVVGLALQLGLCSSVFIDAVVLFFCVFVFVCLSVCLSVGRSVGRLFVCLFVCLFFLFVCLSLFVHLFHDSHVQSPSFRIWQILVHRFSRTEVMVE